MDEFGVVGIDLSMVCPGFATEERQAWSLKHRSKGDARLAVTAEEVEDVCATAKLVVLESVPPYGKGSPSLQTVQGAVRSVLASLRREVIYISPGALKKFATGIGSADKVQMRAAMPIWIQEFADEYSWDDNAVDAWWLRQVGLAWLGHPHAGHHPDLDQVVKLKA